MKSKEQKRTELEKGRKLLEQSEALLFADFSRVSNENLKKLRKAAREAGAEFLVIKKRLLNVLFKEKGIQCDAKQFGGSVGTIFSKKGVEHISGPVYSFFSKLEVPEGGDKGMWVKHILGAYDAKAKAPVDAARVVFIGKLPPREVLLAQLLGMLAAPLRSFMYLLQQKSQKTVEAK
jgi:large subunit ribosomal protein L10